jgi:hypothetical protein
MKLNSQYSMWAEKYDSGERFHAFLLAFTVQIARAMPDFDEAYAYCEKALVHFGRRGLQPNELTNALAGAYERIGRDDVGRGPRRETLEPTGDVAKHYGKAGSVEQLKVKSCQDFLYGDKTGELLLDLFEPDEWISIAKNAFDSAGSVKTALEWAACPDLSEYQFICPNVFKPQADSRRAVHAAEGGWRYMVHEMDDAGVDFDQQVGPILALGEVLPLKLVTFSAGKSLHAWYSLAGQQHKAREFLDASQRLGGDPAFERFTQLSRLPGGSRPGKGPQSILYHSLNEASSEP